MRKFLLALLIVSFFMAGCGSPFSEVDNTEDNGNSLNNEITSVSFNTDTGKKTFNVEIADTFSERKIGLMNRASLPQQNGMLFIFEQENLQTFWMKDTLIPLDIIFADKNLKIVNIVKSAQPCLNEPCSLYTSIEPAKFVLEINGGLADLFGIKIGDSLILE
jgi:uncharacterized protein